MNLMAERCDHCPSRTPLRPDPENLQRAKELHFEPPLDEGIREIVTTLVANGVETFESCVIEPADIFLRVPCRLWGTAGNPGAVLLLWG
jgi:hypothetical protein